MRNCFYKKKLNDARTSSKKKRFIHVRSMDGEIDLVSEKEFLEKAPKELTESEDMNERIINRLKFEVLQREQLQGQLVELEQRKKALAERNRQQRKAKDELEDRLTRLSSVAKSLGRRESLAIPSDDSLAASLPLPLYVLFHQSLLIPQLNVRLQQDQSVIESSIESSI